MCIYSPEGAQLRFRLKALSLSLSLSGSGELGGVVRVEVRLKLTATKVETAGWLLPLLRIAGTGEKREREGQARTARRSLSAKCQPEPMPVQGCTCHSPGPGRRPAPTPPALHHGHDRGLAPPSRAAAGRAALARARHVARQRPPLRARRHNAPCPGPAWGASRCVCKFYAAVFRRSRRHAASSRRRQKDTPPRPAHGAREHAPRRAHARGRRLRACVFTADSSA